MHTILDQGGDYVTLPVSITRIADSWAPIGEAIVALGGQSQIITSQVDAFQSNSLFAQWIRVIEPGLIGTGSSAWNSTSGILNVEALAALNPQVEISYACTSCSASFNQIRSFGIPVVQVNVSGNITSLEQSMVILGQILGPTAMTRAQEYNSFVNDNLNYINATLIKNGVSPVSAAEVWFASTSSAYVYNSISSSASYLTSPVATNSANSICTLTQVSCQINAETLLQLNPSTIFLGSDGTFTNITQLQSDPLLSQLSAVKVAASTWFLFR